MKFRIVTWKVLIIPAALVALGVAGWFSYRSVEVLAQLENTETSAFQEQDRRTIAKAREAVIVMLVASFLAIGLVNGAGLVLRRELRSRRQAEEALRKACDLLEQRVAQRTTELTQTNEALRREVVEHTQAAHALKRNEAMLRREEARVQWLASVGALAGGMAHDLSSLMTPILMSVQLLKKDRPARQRQMLLETVQASVERAAQMTKRLQAYADGSPTQWVPVPILDVIAAVEAQCERILPETFAVHTEASADLWLVAGDATQLAQALTNLCVNASDSMPSGGVVTISARNTTLSDADAQALAGVNPGPHVLVIVTDTGIGISPAAVDKIFDPFFSTKEFDNGTGLRLSSTLGIVRGHKGSINVAREPCGGTRLAIYLPALERPEESRVEASEQPNGSSCVSCPP